MRCPSCHTDSFSITIASVTSAANLSQMSSASQVIDLSVLVQHPRSSVPLNVLVVTAFTALVLGTIAVREPASESQSTTIEKLFYEAAGLRPGLPAAPVPLRPPARYLRQRENPQPPPPSRISTRRTITQVSMCHTSHHSRRRRTLVARSSRRQFLRGFSLVNVIRPAYWPLGQPPPALGNSRLATRVSGSLSRVLELIDLGTRLRLSRTFLVGTVR